MSETLEDYRQKVLRGEKIPPEDYAALVDSLRNDRKAMKKKKEPEPNNLPENLNDLFAETEEAAPK